MYRTISMKRLAHCSVWTRGEFVRLHRFLVRHSSLRWQTTYCLPCSEGVYMGMYVHAIVSNDHEKEHAMCCSNPHMRRSIATSLPHRPKVPSVPSPFDSSGGRLPLLTDSTSRRSTHSHLRSQHHL